MGAALLSRLAVAGVLLCLGSCFRYEPFDEVRARLPAKEFVEINGQAVHFQEWGRGRKNLILLHGLGSSSHEFRKLGPLLGNSRRVVAVDLNGFGYTERPHATAAYGMEGQTALILATAGLLGMERFDLAGRSFGGDLALRVARSEPRRVRKIVEISPALAMKVSKWSPLRNPVLREWAYPVLPWLITDRERARALYAPAYFRRHVLSDEVLDEYRRALMVEGLRRAWRGWGAHLDDLATGAVRIWETTQPVLVISGAQDVIIPQEALAHHLPPDVEWQVVAEAGHSLPEERPEQVARIMCEFLDRGDES